eukprot:s571_g6.t1
MPDDNRSRSRSRHGKKEKKHRGSRGKTRRENEYWRQLHPESFPPRRDDRDRRGGYDRSQLTIVDRAQPAIPSTAMANVKEEDIKMETASDAGTVKYELFSDVLDDSEFQDCQGISDRNQLRKALCEAFECICGRHGGPVQWLLYKFDTAEKERGFRQYLTDTFPMMATLDYVVPSLLSKKEKAFVHISMLSFAPEHSTKPLPYSCTCKELLDEYLVHGFLTDSQALLL